MPAAGFGYGLVLNFSTWVTFTGQHTLAQFLVIEGEAFPFDLAHAIGNFVFFLAFGPALIRVLSRFRARMDVKWELVGAASTALLAAVVLLGALARPPSAQASGANVLAAPMRYLAGAQNPDGGFGLGPGQASSQLATAWVVIGLAASGRDPASLRRDGHDPVAWIRSHLGQIQDAGDTERTILALAAAHAPLGALPARLDGDRRRDGSVSDQVEPDLICGPRVARRR